MSRHCNQRGFALIELVVVITILGILAAFAVPRFTALERQARAAAVEALESSLRSAAALGHSMWLASGQPAQITMQGAPQPIDIVNGYPDRATIEFAVVDFSGFTYTAANGRFQNDGVPADAECRVTYGDAPANGSPSIVAAVSGC